MLKNVSHTKNVFSCHSQVSSKPTHLQSNNPSASLQPVASDNSSKKRKKTEGGSTSGELGFKDLIKKVKSDAAKNPTDWAEVGIDNFCSYYWTKGQFGIAIVHTQRFCPRTRSPIVEQTLLYLNIFARFTK